MAKLITVTKEGFKSLQDELNERKGAKRAEIKEAIKIARGFGDLSENSEYDEAREAQAKNEHRIIELEEMLKNVVVIEESETNSNRITLGKTVKVRNESTGKEITYDIVGPTETDPFAHRISDQSPIGQALIGAQVGDTVTAEAPVGQIKFTVLEIAKTV
ncbi:MAG: transcription elongation factor GreA [Ruminococcaceae bacterium]|nr:transcription elongation factor GreA [Oscillospiraceae bacterium]